MAYEYFFNGVKTSFTDLAFPFIEKKSNTEFILNLVFLSLICSIGFLGLAGLEIGMGFIDDVANISPKVAKFKLKILIDNIERKLLTKPQILFMLKDIVQHAIDSDKWDFIIIFKSK